MDFHWDGDDWDGKAMPVTNSSNGGKTRAIAIAGGW